jgi:hypothetical protein
VPKKCHLVNLRAMSYAEHDLVPRKAAPRTHPEKPLEYQHPDFTMSTPDPGLLHINSPIVFPIKSLVDLSGSQRDPGKRIAVHVLVRGWVEREGELGGDLVREGVLVHVPANNYLEMRFSVGAGCQVRLTMQEIKDGEDEVINISAVGTIDRRNKPTEVELEIRPRASRNRVSKSSHTHRTLSPFTPLPQR